MASHLQTGRRGEALARIFLERKGYLILETNWRHRRAEVDLIVKDGEVLVFVEVKTRSSTAFGAPHDFVNAHKQRMLVSAAAAYMGKIGHDWEIRFDIVSVVLPNARDYRIGHLEDAFFPRLA